MMPHFYDYIVAEELVENPYTAPPDATTANFPLYLDEDTVGVPRTDSVIVNILRESIDS